MSEQAQFDNYFWIYKIGLLIVLLLILELILPLVIKIIKRKFQLKQYDWKIKLKEIFYSPIKILIWILIAANILGTLSVYFKQPTVVCAINKIRDIAVILDMIWLLIKWKKEIQNQIIFRSPKPVDNTSVEFMGKILSIFIAFIGLLIILQRLGINVLPLVAFGGVGAAALALAAKDVLANFFGGLMLYFTRPFVKNDLVEIPTLNISGNVEEIGWYSTCIRELEKVPVYVPNSIFSNAIIKNSSRRTHRRLEEIIKIRYLDFSKITTIISEIKKILHENKKIDNTLLPMVYFTAYNEYSLDIMVKVYTLTTELEDFLQLREEILMQIKTILEKNDADFPYPVTSIDFLNQPKK